MFFDFSRNKEITIIEANDVNDNATIELLKRLKVNGIFDSI